MTDQIQPAPGGLTRAKVLSLILRVGVYIFFAYAGMNILAWAMYPLAGYMVAAALGTFASAALANAIALRIWERGQLSDIGLGWTTASRRNLVAGLAGGAGAALFVLVPPIVARVATFAPVPGETFRWPSLLFVTIVLMFGGIGEEMLFRGYGFQVLVGALGPFATILPVSVLFGIAHMSNPNATTMGVINTVGWGILLGYAFIRSGDLWLSIGLHLGWNWVIPLFGVNLSGLTIGVTGYTLRWSVGSLWSGGDYGPEGSILTTVAIILMFFYLHRAPVDEQRAFLLQKAGEV